MLLSDAGADIIRIDRIEEETVESRDRQRLDLLNRGRRSVAVDLKHDDGVKLVLRLVEQADGLMEGFRPGVTERLGLGPDPCLKRNPKLVYGRMTGWGQDGPMSQAAGHDIDYIALAGTLGMIGRAGEGPVPPINLLGDFGGGGMLLAFGMLAALIGASETGRGQVIDAAMVDGTALLTTMIHSLKYQGSWREDRGTNLLDTGAHFYDVYETADGGFIAVGAIEHKFYRELIELMGLGEETLPVQMDRESWPMMRRVFAEAFSNKSRSQWESIFAGSDACAVPVLTLDEARNHPHLVHRSTFTKVNNIPQPSPAPRFEGTPSTIKRPPPSFGEGGDEALSEWSINTEDINHLRLIGAIR